MLKYGLGLGLGLVAVERFTCTIVLSCDFAVGFLVINTYTVMSPQTLLPPCIRVWA